MTQAYNPAANTNRYNINVLGSGILGNSSVEVIGYCPPATGLPVFQLGYPQIKPVFIQQINSTYGTLIVQPSGYTSNLQDSYYSVYPYEVNVWASDATAFTAWPTGLGCYQRGHGSQALPTGIGPVRGLDNNGTSTFLHG